MSIDDETPDAIAIVGMACRFPGATTPQQFFDNLVAGLESVVPESAWKDLRPEPTSAEVRPKGRAAGIIHDIDQLDAAYFGLTPPEAATMDPQQRLFLECAAEALQSAGLDGAARRTHRIGVYAGMGINTYFLRHVLPNPQAMAGPRAFQAIASNEKDFIATQTSYRLDLDGPSLSIHTACSTSLVAVATAFDALLAHQCDVALAGASSIKPDPSFGFFMEEGGIASPDGVCRAFDAEANGTVGGSGVGVVVLKRLSDALSDGDPIHAVIRGAAVNNDGAAKSGYTAPSVDGQAKVVEEALAVAGVTSDTIGYVEAHGTGTPVGDPIEVAALARAFRADTDTHGSCALGALKTNVGHLDAAAGVAGLIKAALALEHDLIPPTLHHRTPNPALRLHETPFFVNTAPIRFPARDGPRRAGVSSFGIGGTNAHVVLESAPPPAHDRGPADARPQVLPLSARSPTALRSLRTLLADRCARQDGSTTDLSSHPDSLADVAWTLQTGRRRLPHRAAVVATDLEEAAGLLGAEGETAIAHLTDAEERDVAFLFPGQGAQHVGMARNLYHSEPLFRETFDRCSDLFASHLDVDLRHVIYASDDEAAGDRLAETAVTQPALFTIEYALAQLWMSWGVQPVACIGHSLGEYVAACISGVMALDDAVALVAARASLMQQSPEGAMLAVSMQEDEARAFVGGALDVAAVNGPDSCVLSGSVDVVTEFATRFQGAGVEAHRLRVTRAFHSRLMDDVLDRFRQRFDGVALHAPQIPFISNRSGDWITTEEATDPSYWVQHIRETVRFADGLGSLLERPDLALLEVGPGRTLTALVAARTEGQIRAIASLPHPKDPTRDDVALRQAMARLWSLGADVDWGAVHAPARPRRIRLPTYPWERQRHWLPVVVPTSEPGTVAPSIDEQATVAAQPLTDPIEVTKAEPDAPARHARPALATPHVAPTSPLEKTLAAVWEDVFGFTGIGIRDDFFALGGDSLLAARLAARLSNTFAVDIDLPRLFEVGTIEQLAPAVEALLVEKVESMSEEEAERLLKG